MWVIFVLNHLANPALGWHTPIEALTGTTADISPILAFPFYASVLYKTVDATFPSDSMEREEWFVGFAENVGDAMTYKVVDKETKKLVYCSMVHLANVPGKENLHLVPPDRECPDIVQEVVKTTADPDNPKVIDIEDLQKMIGHSYLTDKDASGTRDHMQIVCIIEIQNTKVAKDTISS